MTIRPYTPADAPHLDALLRHIWGNDPWTLGYYRAKPDSPAGASRFARTLVADPDGHGRPIGLGTAWTNPFHPHALYLSINVHPAMRRKGVGTRLLEGLAAFNHDHRPLQCATWQTSIDGVRFLERHGFAVARRTWEPILHVADVDSASLPQPEADCAEIGYTIVSLADLPAGHEQQLARLLADLYTATHPFNPPRPMGLEGWVDLVRGDPPLVGATFVAFHGSRLVAMSTAHADEEPDRLTLGWAGVAKEHRQHERQLMLALTARQIRHALRTGVTALQGEFDSTNPWAMLQMAAFPFRPAPCWLTFQRTHHPV